MIPQVQLEGILTTAFAGLYLDTIKSAEIMFLARFFPTNPNNISDAALIEVFTEREQLQQTKDVIRGTEGNHQNGVIREADIYRPPFHKGEYLLTNLKKFNKKIGESMTLSSAEKMLADSRQQLQNIDNTHQLNIAIQIRGIMQTGIVPIYAEGLADIDYGRTSSSNGTGAGIMDLSGGNLNWSNPGQFENTHIEAINNFIRPVGHSGGQGNYTEIIGLKAWEVVKAQASLNNRLSISQNLASIQNNLQRMVDGGSYLGTITVGDSVIDFWSYSTLYKDFNGDYQSFTLENGSYLLAPDFVGNTWYAGVPELAIDVETELDSVIQQIHTTRPGVSIFTWTDQRQQSQGLGLQEAPLAVPYFINKLVTFTNAVPNS